jgi:hypothetical protein
LKWLILFLEFDFSIICKPRRFHFVVDALSQMPNIIEQNGILDKTTNVILFLLQLVWLEEIFEYFTIEKFPIHYSEEQKKKLALITLHFFLV